MVRDKVRTGNGWQTPEDILDRVRHIAPILLDPCTWPDNPTDAYYIRTAGCDPDGLTTGWAELLERCPLPSSGLVFVNPPYGRGHMQPWADKIAAEARKGAEIVALTRGDTSTKWARTLLGACDRVCFPPRIKFKGAKGSPNFTNLILYYGGRGFRFWDAFQDLGPVLTVKQ